MEPSTQTVTLSDEALIGVGPARTRGLMAQLPKTVRLGRIRPKARPMVPRLRAYFTASVPTPPASINRRDKAAISLARMYMNDVKGCCVISGKAHALGVTSANDTDSGGVVLATDTEILQQYESICGPGDRGCVITDVLDVMRSSGFVAGGRRFKIDGYVAVDWTDQLEVKVCQVVFGATTIGINLPQAWTTKSVWEPTTSRIVGGHDVTPIDYGPEGVYVSSWGRIYLITWPAFTSRMWLEEMYAILYQNWYGSDRLAPNGIDATTLKNDLDKLGSGTLPDIEPTPPPAPVPPPSPPLPPPLPPVPPGGFDVFELIRKVRDTIAALRQFGQDHDFVTLLSKLATIWGISVNFGEDKPTLKAAKPPLTAAAANKLADDLEAALPKMQGMMESELPLTVGWDWLVNLMPVLADLISHIFKRSTGAKAEEAKEEETPSKKKLTKAELKAMTGEEIREYAREHNLNLHGASNHDDLVDSAAKYDKKDD